MTAKELMERLQAVPPNVDVLIHDASTDGDLPVGKVDLRYGLPVVLHVKDESSE